ncbi:Glucose dehydrogenase [FAD, quinone] [Blattella germanica]|nr:Glucose dehydrogenase [FAD, quinone] [Blattella germanica]
MPFALTIKDENPTRLNWNYTSEPNEILCGGEPCWIPRGKVLGGSSVVNAMICIRGNRRDYDHWSELGNEGWDFESVLPYFKKSEDNLDPEIAKDTKYHSTGGYLKVSKFTGIHPTTPVLAEGWKELGYNEVDFNGPTQTGYSYYQATQYNAERWSVNRAFLEPVRRTRPNLKVITNVRVTKVLIDPDSKTAYGVEYIGENNRNISGKLFAKKDVILSGGTVGSAELLLRSGIGPKEVLDPLSIPTIQNLQVGENYQDHFCAQLVEFEFGEYEEETVPDLLKDLVGYMKPIREGKYTQGLINEIIVLGKTKFADPDDYPDLEITFHVNHAKSKGQKNVLVFNHSLNRPKSRGKLTINDTEPFSPPLIYQNYFSDPDDVKVFVDGIDLAKRLEKTEAFKKYGLILKNDFNVTVDNLKTILKDPRWKDYTYRDQFTNYHITGTCKMGPKNDTAAVVDNKLKVYGVNNLRVIDASIMPHLIGANLMCTTVMIAEKGADLIKQYWNSSKAE